MVCLHAHRISSSNVQPNQAHVGIARDRNHAAACLAACGIRIQHNTPRNDGLDGQISINAQCGVVTHDRKQVVDSRC